MLFIFCNIVIILLQCHEQYCCKVMQYCAKIIILKIKKEDTRIEVPLWAYHPDDTPQMGISIRVSVIFQFLRISFLFNIA